MKNRSMLMEKIDKINMDVENIEAEVALFDFCRKRGLNYNNASDYARAVSESGRLCRENQTPADVLSSKSNAGVLLNSKSVAKTEVNAYNIIDPNITAANVSESIYKWTDVVKDAGVWLKQKLTGRIVRNETGKKIAIVGQPSDAPHETKAAYLSPGDNTEGVFDDVDAVIIAPGQRFFASRDEMNKENGMIVNEGAIKIPNGMLIATVERSSKSPDVFYVNAGNTTYYRPNQVPDSRWRLP